MKFVPAFVKRNPAVSAIWRLFKDPPFEPITLRFSQELAKWRQQTIVQIGTNDGLRDDPISSLLRVRRLWRALLVEPLPEYFGQLVANYGSSSRFMFEQSAVGEENGECFFYHIDERARQSSDWRDYFDRIGSLNRTDLIINLGDVAESMAPYIVETKVNVVSIRSLLKKWKLDRIDALIVDAEGMDWQIVKQTLEIGLRPKVIMFEYAHLTDAQRDVAIRTLEAEYIVEQFARDYFLVLR